MHGLEDELKKFGLNSYQAKAVVFLLENPDSTAEEVSKYSGIPMAKVYQVLDSLVKMGLASYSLGRPKRYSALPADQIVSRLVGRIEDRLASLKDSARTLLEQLSEASVEGRLQPVKIVDSEEGAWAEYGKMVRRTKEYIYNTSDSLGWDSGYSHGNLMLPAYYDLIQKRKVRIRCLYPDNYNLLHTVTLVPKGIRRKLFKIYSYPGHEARKIKKDITLFFSVSDDERVFLVLRDGNEIVGGLFINDPLTARTFREVYDKLWEKGVPVTSRMVEAAIRYAGKLLK